MAHTYSSQQLAVFRWVDTGNGCLKLTAVAGAGKTYTVTRAILRMKGSVAALAYNKKAADEFGEKLRELGAGSQVQSGTFHSFGFRAWRRVAPKVRVDDKKMRNILATQRVPEVLEGFVTKLVSLAKNHAIGVLTPFDDASAWWHLVNHFDLGDELPADTFGVETEDLVADGIVRAKQCLKVSASMDLEVIDFDDMIYAPLLHDAKVYQNDWIAVDEAQDTNPARRALAKKMLRPGGRAIFVGDPCQAIYGFTGADSDAMDIIGREFGCQDLPLTVTYRCPKAVVDVARQIVSHITAADSAPTGVVAEMDEESFDKLPQTLLGSDAAILCRNTKPLVALAYDLIRRQIPCHVEGRDIGRGLMALAGKWRIKYVNTLTDKLDEYLRRETEKALAKGQEQKAESLADKVDTLKVIIRSLPTGATMVELKAAVDRLFGDTPEGETPANLTLSTVHKSKGREWSTVYLFGRNKFMPSKFARQQWQLNQEMNLVYVAVTRSMGTLVMVNVA